jgi:DNA-binding transcriptional LysR family regulator
VRLGVQSTIGPARFGEFMQVFGAAHVEVELAVSTGKAAALAERLKADELDLAVVTRLPDLVDKLSLLPLYRERYGVILPPDHALAAKDSLMLQDLAGLAIVDRPHCEMRDVLCAACEGRSVEFHGRFRAERDDWVQGMVQAGLGIALFPERSVFLPGIEARPLADPVIEREICLASVPGRPFPPAAAAMVRLAQTFAWPH